VGATRVIQRANNPRRISMATTSSGAVAGRERVARRSVSIAETKASTKTTEFYAMIAVIAGILIACWWIGRDDGVDAFKAERAWLYVAIVASAYMVSRGLAKSGSHDYDGDRDDIRER
jgi:multisubunit Na+/H+ antiporter MnhG subunit